MHAVLVLEKYLHAGILIQAIVTSIAVVQASLNNLAGMLSFSRYMEVDLLNLVPTTFYGMPVPISSPTPTPTPTPSPGSIAGLNQMWSSFFPSLAHQQVPGNMLQPPAMWQAQPAFHWSYPVLPQPSSAIVPAHSSFLPSFFSPAHGLPGTLGTFIAFVAAIMLPLWAVCGWAFWGGVWYFKTERNKKK